MFCSETGWHFWKLKKNHELVYMNMLLAMSSNYSRSAQPYVAKVCWSFVDGQNYQLGWLHTECGFPFCLGILSIRQRVAQTVFSLPRNHRTLFLRPTHCLEELLFACKWGVHNTNVLQLKPIGCTNARRSFMTNFFSIHIMANCTKCCYPIMNSTFSWVL